MEVRNCSRQNQERENTDPQKTRQSENSNCAICPPVSGSSIPAITMMVKVDVNIMNSRISRNIVPPRSITALVGSAFTYSPIG